MKLYEILIPTYDNKGLSFPKEVVTAYLQQVAQLAGGFTATRSGQGDIVGGWVSKDGELHTDFSSPMRVALDSEKLPELLELTAKAFNQKAVMAYVVSPEVIFFEA